MKLTLGFDVYGTLIDTHGVISELEKMIGATQAPRFSQVWREKQLEYTFRRGAMRKYLNFGICTRQALDHTAETLQHALSDEQKGELVSAYDTLPAFGDAGNGLSTLKNAGHALFAFSNGQAEAVETVLENAGIRQYFRGVVSVDEIGTFKPDPEVYHHFLKVTHSAPGNTWLVSSNGFDVIGAVAIGMKAAWIQRSPAVILDPWEFSPTVILDSLDKLTHSISSRQP